MENNGELRMSLMGHLQELRKRLLRCVIAILLLAVVSLVYSKRIFAVLMQPVLNALPASSRSLIYTSGIEEINVLMKVGLYCGLFLTTPVILSQLWGFVAPGLYPKERKLAAPFVLFGSLAFLVGALFCYFGVLPTAFQYLLNDERAAAVSQRLDSAGLREREALRFVRNGDLGRAGELARKGVEDLGARGDGQIDLEAGFYGANNTEVLERLAGLGRLVDAVQEAGGEAARPVLRTVLEKRVAAVDALAGGDLSKANGFLDEAARGLSATLLIGDKHVPLAELGRATAGDGSLYNGQHAASSARVAGPGHGLASSVTDPFNTNFGSGHRDLCQFVLADGSVRSFDISISEMVLGQLARRGK